MAKSNAPLLIAAGAAVLLLSGKKKKKSSASKCPPSVSMSWDSIPSVNIEVQHAPDEDVLKVTIAEVAYNEVMAGNSNIVDITKKTIAHLLPGHCVGDKSIILDLTLYGDIKLKMSAPEGFYNLGWDISNDLWQAQVIDGDTFEHFTEVMKQWWHDHMGDAPLPSPPNA